LISKVKLESGQKLKRKQSTTPMRSKSVKIVRGDGGKRYIDLRSDTEDEEDLQIVKHEKRSKVEVESIDLFD
jgi:hypothetical protein